jgi:hypothetical protein
MHIYVRPPCAENALLCRRGHVGLGLLPGAGRAGVLAAVRSGAHAGHARTVVAGTVLAFGGRLLIVAAQWDSLGQCSQRWRVTR